MNRRSVTVVVAGGLLIAGWWIFGLQSPPAAETVASSPSTAASQASQSTSVATAASATATPTTSAAETATATAPRISAREQQQLETFAGRFARTFARPTGKLDPHTWWKRVAAMLTDDAVDDYLGTDPSMVPFTKVTGPAALVASTDESDGFWLQKVAVPTDAGTYQVLIQRVTPGLSDRLLVIELDEP